MREIKFRAWNKTTSKMIDLYVVTPFAVGGNVKERTDGLYLPFAEDLELMQYTGLKDKKTGKEIFEGDLVRPDGKQKGGKDFKSVSVEYLTDGFWAGNMRLSYFDELVVIGNIYESKQ